MTAIPAILDDAHAAILNAFALSNVLLAFDYDGTLAPIAPTPDAARMREKTRRLLVRAAQLYPCVVISGRSLADLEQRLDGIPLWSLVGNHGLESAGAAGDATRGAGWTALLHRRLPDAPGLIVEDKGHTITIHYRHVEDKDRIRRAIREAIHDLDVRALVGIEAVSLLPREGRHKGTALQEAQRQFACDTAVYVGDDETDEDVFRSSSPGDVLTIKVGRSTGTAARFCLKDQREIDALLQALVTARHERRHPARARYSRG